MRNTVEKADELLEVLDRFLLEADYTVSAALEDELLTAVVELRTVLSAGEGKGRA